MKKTCIVLILSLFFVSGSVEAARQKTINHAENAYNAGITAYEKKEFQNAVYAFQNSIDYNPKLYKSHTMLAMALIMNNETESAVQVLKRTIDSFPNEWEAQALLGEYYAGVRDYEKSIDYYKRALEVKKLKNEDKEAIQKKLTAVEGDLAAEWRVSEDMKVKIIKAVDTKLESSWRPRVIEKRGKNLHMVFVPRDEDYPDGKWNNIIDLKCYTDKKDLSFSYINERIVADYRAQGVELDTLEQDDDNRYFETHIDTKPRLNIVGRIFPSPLGYCLSEVQSHSRMKEEDVKEWMEVLRNFTVGEVEGFVQ